MATVTFTPPRQWEDWCDWALGIWLVLSPWVLQFQFDDVAVRNAVIVGTMVVFAEVITLSWFQVWEEWINVALGTWLVISPFALEIANPVATANFVIVGALMTALALYEVREVRRERQAWPHGRAGRP